MKINQMVCWMKIDQNIQFELDKVYAAYIPTIKMK